MEDATRYVEDVRKIHWRVRKIQGGYNGGCRGHAEDVRKLHKSLSPFARLQKNGALIILFVVSPIY
jgi:hypothetical protein